MYSENITYDYINFHNVASMSAGNQHRHLSGMVVEGNLLAKIKQHVSAE